MRSPSAVFSTDIIFVSSQTQAVLRHQSRRRRSEGLPADAGRHPAGRPLPPAAADVLATRLADLRQGRAVRPAVTPAYCAHQRVVLLSQRCARTQLRSPRPSHHGHRDALMNRTRLRSCAPRSPNLTTTLNCTLLRVKITYASEKHTHDCIF